MQIAFRLSVKMYSFDRIACWLKQKFKDLNFCFELLYCNNREHNIAFMIYIHRSGSHDIALALQSKSRRCTSYIVVHKITLSEQRVSTVHNTTHAPLCAEHFTCFFTTGSVFIDLNLASNKHAMTSDMLCFPQKGK